MVMCVHLYRHFVNRYFKTSRWRATLNQIDDPPLRAGRGFDLAWMVAKRREEDRTVGGSLRGVQ